VRARGAIAPIAFFLAVLGAWEVCVHVSGVAPYVLPAPSRIVQAGIANSRVLIDHASTTLVEALLGLTVGAAVGAILAVVIGLVPGARRTLYPLLVLTQTVPTIVLAPLLIIWTGFGMLPKVIVVALTVFFPVLVASVTAWSQADSGLVEMVRGLGGSRRQIAAWVRLPAIVPAALGGLRIAATYAVGAAVVGEYMAGESGLGVFIQRSRKAFAVDQIFVAVAIIALLTVALFLSIDRLSKAVMPWQRSASVLGEIRS
jgi:ABC-type nitrate/sulfonate/bicarbonate transport system permease component